MNFYETVLGAIGGLLQQRNEKLKKKKDHQVSNFSDFESEYHLLNAQYIAKIEDLISQANYIVAMSNGDWTVDD